MRLALMGGCLLLVGRMLPGQAVVALADRQEVLLEGQVLRRTAAEPKFTAVPDLPDFWPGLKPLGRMEVAWDGSKAYQVDFTEDRHPVACSGRALFTAGGERQWFWTEPKILPVKEGESWKLLGAWEDSLLFLRVSRDTKAKPQSASSSKGGALSQCLVRVDLLTGETAQLMEVQVGSDARMTAAFSRDAFYLFTATGKAVRVRVGTEPWSVDSLHANVWGEAGITLCKDTGEFQNPSLFGKAFLDGDGSILVPAQVFLPLDRADIDLAWSKLPQLRKAELIQSGFWPVPADKEVGWKDDVRFLRFDPSTTRFTQVDRSRFDHLVVEEEKPFTTRRFEVMEPTRAFTSEGGRILPLEKALRTAVPTPAPNTRPATTIDPASRPGPAAAKREEPVPL
ncbi:hypothetical protein [Geothrix terrae]|uniref:hypothetical protein n=1 Tax=Geothrix terrae TaxID=2922720 RepID=UPI001FACF445|nr:hypothetical protein [Geothrix terrae]